MNTSSIIKNVNQNSDLYLLIQELESIKTQMGASTDNLYVQFPDSTNDLYLGANSTYEREVTINRKLKQLSVSVPEGVYLTIINDNSNFAWFTDEAGLMEDINVTFGTLKIKVQNTTSEAVRWTMKAVFA